MSVILDAIKENLRHIKIIYEPTESSFTKDTKNTGDARELTVRQFIECYFPNDYQVKKGLIYSKESNSQEIDCVLLAPNHPRLVTPVREVILAEGVHAAIEIKPDISTLTDNSEFYRALKQIATVKNLKREIKFMTTGYIPPDHSIPCVIFSNKSRPLHEITECMLKLVYEKKLEPKQFPDLIVTMDNGIIFHSAYATQCMFKDFISAQQQIIHNNIFLEIPNFDSTLALFLMLLYSFTPPEPYLTDPILKGYLEGINTPPITLKQYID